MPKGVFNGPLEQIDDCCWRIPKSYKPGMRVDGLIYADDQLIEQIRDDQAPEQVANVAFLPGIQQASLAMPDIHWGYGFCIGGVCATDPGRGRRDLARRRRLRHQLRRAAGAHQPVLPATSSPASRQLMDALFGNVPAGVGTRRAVPVQRARNSSSCMAEGSRYLASRGLATDGDIEHTEAGGCLDGAEPDARQRAGPAARRRPVRHARLGQPLPGSAGRRRGLRRRRPPRRWGWRRTWSA